MKKIEYGKDLENKYLEAFKNEIKSLNLKWQDLKKSNNQLKDFPDKVEDILIADFNHLLDWYFEYLDIINKTPSIKKCFVLIFNYTDYFPIISKFFYDNSKDIKLTSCYYCDIYPIGKYSKKKNKERISVDFDHFFPKEQCPILALSLRNLIPSCQVCNSRMKGRKDFLKFYEIDGKNKAEQKNILRKLSPSSPDYDFRENAMIFVFPKEGFSNKLSFFENMESYKIHFSSDKIYTKEINSFFYNQRYNSVSILGEALSILDLKRNYPISKIHEMKELFKSNGMLVSENQIEEIIFRKEYDNKIGGPLLLMKNDLKD